MGGEFDRIARSFRPIAARMSAALDLRDDAALLDPPPGATLALTHDALVEGVHFVGDEPAGDIAAKLLRTNYADLAAMGAEPVGVLLSLALTARRDDAWVNAFADGLAADLATYGGGLLGGDSVAAPGSGDSLGLTAIGAAPRGAALRRDGARPGMAVWVSGTIGDGALGLLAATERLANLKERARADLVARYRRPTPRLALGIALRGVAAAAMDVSDGLVADLRKLANASGCGATIDAARIPLSAAARAAIAAEPALWRRAVTGGDDYELVFAAPAAARAAVAAAGAVAGVAVSEIGMFEAPPGLRVKGDDGAPIAFASEGWDHGSGFIADSPFSG